MSIEQNEPESSQPHQGPPPAAGSRNGDSGQVETLNAQQRRRRRRRKGSRPSQEGAAPGQASATGDSAAEPARQHNRDAGSRESGSRESGVDAALPNPPREHHGEQRPAGVRDAAGQGVQQESGRDQSSAPRPRHGGGGQQQHGKKQQRQAKSSGGGSNQGRPMQQKDAQPRVHREHNPGNGSGPPAGAGGARRKNKVRRTAPSFVGPMDHSYRVANGNIADGPPSTMDFRSNYSNGSGNGNVHGRNGYLDPAEITVPALLRDDAPVRILCFIEELFVVAKMQETARKLGVKVGFVKAEKEAIAKLLETPEAERPSLIVFDLNNANAKPLTLIPKLKAKLKRSTSIIGFLSHIQGDLKMKAIEAGCDTVMPKAAFSQNLPNLLRRHGLDEELEALEV